MYDFSVLKYSQIDVEKLRDKFVCILLYITGWIQGLTTEPQQKKAGPGEIVPLGADAQNKLGTLK